MRRLEPSTARVAVSGPAPPELAWGRYVALALWPTWAPQIRAVDASGEVIAPGVNGVVHAVGGLRVRFTIEAVDHAARQWTWRVAAGPVRMRMTHGVQERPGGGCRTTLAVTGAPGVVQTYSLVSVLALRRLVSSAEHVDRNAVNSVCGLTALSNSHRVRAQE